MQELLAQSEQQLSSAIRSQAEGFQATLQKELQAQAEAITNDLQQQLINQVPHDLFYGIFVAFFSPRLIYDNRF